MLAPWKKSYDKPRQHIKKQRHHFPDKNQSSQNYGFSSSHVQMWELEHKEGWVDAFEFCCWRRFLRVPWILKGIPCTRKEIKPVNPKGNQLWIFIERIDAEAEVPILWPPDAKRQLFGKDSDAGKDWRQEEKGITEDEMVGWHHWLNGHEFEQTPWDSEVQGSLACFSPWGHKELDTT